MTTLAPYRNHGLATAAASLVARHVRAQGQVPVWSTGEANYASLRVAQKRGVEVVVRRTCGIPRPGPWRSSGD